MRKSLMLAGAAALAAVLIGVAAYAYLVRSTPGRFALNETPAPAAGVTPSPSAVDLRMRTICLNLAPEAELARCLAEVDDYLSVCQSTTAGANWIIGAPSEAGMRVHERFLEIQSPHEAVARTRQVAGGMAISGSGQTFTVQSACVAVSTMALESVDTVPGMRTSDRDGTIADVLGAINFPVATFRTISAITIAGADDGRQHQLKIPGQFTAHGVTRPVTASLQAVKNGQQIEGVGSFAIRLQNYGMHPPENPVAAVDSTVTIELHVFLVPA